MTFTSIASNKPQFTDSNLSEKAAKLSKISIATSLLAIVGLTFLPNLLWMQASHPAELTAIEKQALANCSELKTAK